MIPVFDGHNDTLFKLGDADDPIAVFRDNPGGHIDLARSVGAGFAGGFFAIWTPPEHHVGPDFGRIFVETEHGYEAPLASAESREWARQYAENQLALVARLERELPGLFRVVRSRRDLDHAADGISAILHLEGAEPVEPDGSDLEAWYARGIRSIGLVWSRPNAFGTGVPFRFPSGPDIGSGLTDAGRQLVMACNELGILVDLAHLNERGFRDVADITTAPVVVTHACVHTLAATARNLTDTQIDTIGRTGGVMGINFHAGDLRADGQRDANTPVSLIVDHVRYVADRIGIDHVAFGSDFDGATVPASLNGVAGFPQVVHLMTEAGFTAADIDKVAHGNWYRVLRETWIS